MDDRKLQTPQEQPQPLPQQPHGVPPPYIGVYPQMAQPQAIPAPFVQFPGTYAPGQPSMVNVPYFYAPQPQVVSSSPQSTIPSSERPLGGYFNFVRNLVFGFFFPIISGIMVFAMETPIMSRLGVLIGTANVFFWCGTYLMSWGFAINTEFSSYYYSYYYYNYYDYNYGYYDYRESEYKNSHDGDPLWIIGLIIALCSLALYGASLILWRQYAKLYKSEACASERMKIRTGVKLGTCVHTILAFIISFTMPLVGTMACLAVLPTLRGRFGALLGMSGAFIFVGLCTIPVWYLTAITGNPILFVGIFLAPCTVVHFRRAIMSAELIEAERGMELPTLPT